MAFLTAISGSGFGKQYDLNNPVTVLGRHPDCDVTIDVGAVSRQHARLHAVNGRHELEDLKSRNGTFLNGQLIAARTMLEDGDLIRICDVEFSYHAESDISSEMLSGAAMAGDGSSFGVMLIDDDDKEQSPRAVQSKLDIRGTVGGSQLTSSSEVRLKAVLEITQSLGRAVKLEEVLPRVLDTLFKVFLQADRAFIVLRRRRRVSTAVDQDATGRTGG
ncbi:MAG: FHA domain-containing protein [Pirellulaceae bacterium]